MGEFVRVADVDALPEGTGMVVEAKGQELALFRVGEQVFAIDNECPHRDGPLGDGELAGEIVTCPFHSWEINVRTGEVLDNPSVRARTFACRVEDGAVYVEL
ncbi:MAG TPA: nitrite reductase small subunit NirD [Chthonomonadales bacterium]|nr:nitrite reductase small subunit NirD [Chthonomonadales bacterium]